MAVTTRTRGRRNTPLHEVVKADILSLIRDRGLTAGDKIPHIRELAKLCGVSYVTASRAVSTLVDAGVLSSRVGDGTYVEAGASPELTPPPQHTIGAVLRDVYQLDLFNLGASIRSIGEFSKAQGLKMQMFIVHEDESSIGVETLIQEVTDQNAEGLIIASRVDPRLILRLKREQIPFVWIGDELPHYDTHSVMGSKFGGMLAALRAMRQLGQMKLAVLHDPFLRYPEEAIRVDAAQRGEAFNPTSIVACPHGDREAVVQATKQLLKQGYDGFVCTDEQMTGWAQEQTLQMNRKIPEDVLFATFAPPSSDYQMPAPYIAMCAPMEDMAREACRLLLALLEGEKNPVYQRIFDVKVLIPSSIRNR